MNAKKLVSFVLPIMLLGGCGTDSTDKVEKKPDSKIESKEDKTVNSTKKLKVEEYAPALIEPMTDATKIFTDIENLLKTDKPYEEFKADHQAMVTSLNKDFKKIKEINPPTEFVEEQKKMVKVMETYEEACRLQTEAFSEKNKEKMELSKQKMYEAGKLSKETTTRIGDRLG